jgi:uncharacterized protein
VITHNVKDFRALAAMKATTFLRATRSGALLGAVDGLLLQGCSPALNSAFRPAALRAAGALLSGLRPDEGPDACDSLRCSYNVGVAGPRFEWDEKKSRTNLRKHGVSFAEAQTVFLDENALLIDDPAHSSDEDRFVLLGISANLRLLVVCHAYRRRGDVIRIISARKADAGERRAYAERGRP